MVNQLTFSQDSIPVKPLALPPRNNDTVSNGNRNPLPLHQVTWSRETGPDAKVTHTAHPTVLDSYGSLVLWGRDERCGLCMRRGGVGWGGG